MTVPETTPEIVLSAESLLFPWWLLLLYGLLSLAVGTMFLMTPGISTEFLITLIGAYWLVGGLFTIGSLAVSRAHAGWKIFLSVINIVAGVLILSYPLFSTIFLLAFFIIFIGFWGIFIGIGHLYHAYVKKDAGTGVLGIVSLIFGLVLLAYPLFAATLIPLIIGVFAVMSGVAAIIASFGVKKICCTQ